ncbi:hypothetical protein TNIN_432461 [Trichonephila inaurata madagascariensis]|uniref:Uncharacterized protein n=1 Tax=Trichonephila inaurata madagascariensis TaxID=2747483 RepID=A0A8X6M8J8_9ARAC|nr:hypothetical protein TNIN_432461 [Trichonephila inaurata madagascariensis]
MFWKDETDAGISVRKVSPSEKTKQSFIGILHREDLENALMCSAYALAESTAYFGIPAVHVSEQDSKSSTPQYERHQKALAWMTVWAFPYHKA